MYTEYVRCRTQNKYVVPFTEQLLVDYFANTRCRLQFVAFLCMIINETHQIVKATVTLVFFDAFTVYVYQNSRITVDAFGAAQTLRFGAVDLGHFDS